MKTQRGLCCLQFEQKARLLDAIKLNCASNINGYIISHEFACNVHKSLKNTRFKNYFNQEKFLNKTEDTPINHEV